MSTGTRNVEEFLALARERFRLSADAEAETRLKMLEDLKFYAGDQWPDNIVRQRTAENRPFFTFNVLPQFVNQVANEIRQNKPSPLIRPVDSNADVDTADVLMGLARHIERQSKADTARSYAAAYAAVAGRGWYRIVTDYESDDSFDQEIFIKRIKNQSSVYPDPTCQEPDYSDMGFCFVVEDLLRSEYKALYPKSEAAGLEDFSSLGDTAKDWGSAETVRVAEYFYVETDPIEVALVQDGEGNSVVLPLSEVPEGVQILAKRTVDQRKVCWAKINGVEILEEKEWPSKWIGIIPVLGTEMEIDGKTHLQGMVRNAIDAQKQYNYMRTMQTETIALAPRNPYIAAEGQLEGFELMWQNANHKNYAVLPYKPVAIDGTPVPPPQRQNFEPAIQATTMAVNQAYEDLKRANGIHDASLGARSNETSGIAIRERRQEGDTANYHYVDNLSTSITHETRILIDLMRAVYDTPGRVKRIIGDDESEKTVVLNEPFVEGGIEKIYDIRTGRYDVAVTVGPSVSTKRQATAEMMLELTRAFPQLMEVAGDLVIKTFDVPEARQIAERLKKTLPPQLQEGDDKATIPPQIQAQMAQMGQMLEAMKAELEASAGEMDTLKRKERIELEKLQIQREQMQLDADIEMAKIGSVEAMKRLTEDLADIRMKVEMQERQEQAAIAAEQQQQAAQQQQQMPEAA